MQPNRWNFPTLGFGLGLRSVHYHTVLDTNPAVDWFEIISENYLDTGGRRQYLLDQVRERYPIVLHGVSMSIGSVDPIDYQYLKNLKQLADRVQAPWLSDHLCWTGVAGKNVHDLLPMVYNTETLRHTATRVRQIAEFLERPLIIENPSVYIEFAESDMTEWDFMAQLAIEADCGFLLDVNNIYVSAYNHGFDPNVYVDAIPVDRIVQFHLAGHTNKGTHIIDTHSDHVIDPVWQLYERAVARTGMRATMVEWDEDIPSFEVLMAEITKAKDLYHQAMAAEQELQLVAV
jgi:uncharacterized protein